MYTILRFLFSDKPYTAGNSWLLLAVRIIFGGLLMSHGIATVSYTHLTLPTIA